MLKWRKVKLICAALLGDSAGVRGILNREYLPGVPRPDQEGVNWALRGAAAGDHRGIVELLLDGAYPRGVPRPDQDGVYMAHGGTARFGHVAVVARLRQHRPYCILLEAVVFFKNYS